MQTFLMIWILLMMFVLYGELRQILLELEGIGNMLARANGWYRESKK